jgi:enoyl-CoA hydratase/carnithine racemase
MDVVTEDHVVLTQADRVLEVRLNRPEKKNALTRAMYDGMAAAFDQADADPEIRCVVLTGTGDAFTSGNDVKDFQKRSDGNVGSSAGNFLRAISTMRTPLVAAVNGMAIGVGTTMLFHCDIVVVARSARLQMPFTNLGLVPEAASSLTVPRVVGMQRASALLMLGESIDGETALAWGIANRLVDGPELMNAARDYASRLAVLPPEAVRQTKALIRHGVATIAERMAEEGKIFGRQTQSPEAREAFAAFAEKRRPDFSQFS